MVQGVRIHFTVVVDSTMLGSPHRLYVNQFLMDDESFVKQTKVERTFQAMGTQEQRRGGWNENT